MFGEPRFFGARRAGDDPRLYRIIGIAHFFYFPPPLVQHVSGTHHERRETILLGEEFERCRGGTGFSESHFAI